MEERLLDKKQVAQILNTSCRHILDLSRRGELPSLKVGRLVRFRPKDVEKFIEIRSKQRPFR